MTKTKSFSKSTVACAVMLAVYAILTLIGALTHELWFDEAQAWAIARDNSIAGIFQQLEYEGHPPLWYLILYAFSHLGFECSIIPFISWFFTVIAAAVVLFKSPFSLITKAALVFSGGFLFFNSVISRVYCLINLILVLIAWLFPKRKEHPVIFGILIALLANTHICVSGFIGIIGIFMIIDLFNDWKNNSTKKNVLNVTGLAISGVGVLMMVLPLLNSLSSNSSTSDKEITADYCIDAIATSFMDISHSLIGAYYEILPLYVLSGIIGALFILLIILMRHKTRPLLILIFFCIFYIITTEIFWSTIPNRAHIFALVFVVAAWIAENEQENKASEMWNKIKLAADTEIIRKFFAAVRKADENYKNTYIKIISVILMMSVPVGATYLFSDYAGLFCPAEPVAEYIEDNIPEGAVFVTDDYVAVQVAAYLPEYKFYSLNGNRFGTYDTHKKPIPITNEEIYNDLKDYENIYLIRMFVDEDAIQSNRNIVYYARGGMPYGVNIRYIEVSTFDIEKDIAAYTYS